MFEVTRTGVIVEIEELLFDTLDLRADALQAALLLEQVAVDRASVRQAHAGVPAAIALTRLDAALSLDSTARELVLHRATDHVRRALEAQAPSFDTTARDALVLLAAEFALGVVTRASRADALHLLQLADLDACVAVTRSLDGLEPERHHERWSDVLTRLHAAQAVALAPSALLHAARAAGLRTVAIDGAYGRDDSAPPWDGSLDSLGRVNASFIASLT